MHLNLNRNKWFVAAFFILSLSKSRQANGFRSIVFQLAFVINSFSFYISFFFFTMTIGRQRSRVSQSKIKTSQNCYLNLLNDKTSKFKEISTAFLVLIHKKNLIGRGKWRDFFSVHLFNQISGVFCLRFKWCLSFLWLRCRHVRHTIIVNAPIVIQMPNTMGKWTYQLSSSLMGFVADAFILSMKSGSPLVSVLHAGDWVVVVVLISAAIVLLMTSSANKKSKISCD